MGSAWSPVVGKGNFSVPPRTKSPQPIKVKICTADNVGRSSKWAKVHNDRLGVTAPYMGEVVDWRSFSGVLLGKRTTDPERSSPTLSLH
jgi:hypothetical protein